MIEIEIDGRTLEVDEGASIIEAADDAGIYIPRFCYHKKLSVAANCRMCLVEVDKVGKPLPACATPVTSDMKVKTKSRKAVEAQRSVMEFLLINHPLDCPICDQGGSCELQDLAMGFGSASSQYDEPKRAVFSEDIGPLVETEMTRCIHCTRCVRFGEEVAGLRELGATGRGEHMEIGTYVQHFLQSELSGNVIDLCPVGALTAKPSQYTCRSWEVIEHPSIASHDCVGTNIFVHSKGREYFHERWVMRVVPRENESINETWMSDRDRFSYEGLTHPERCVQPILNKQGDWHAIDWTQALVSLVTQVQSVTKVQGSDQIAALSSPNATVEEYYLLQKLLRALGSHNIDYRLRELDYTDQASMPAYPGQALSMGAIEELSTIILLGSNLRFEQPMIAHRVRKAALNGATISVINPIDYPYTFPVTTAMVQADLVSGLAEIIAALSNGSDEYGTVFSEITPSEHAQDIAKQLQSATSAGLFLGAYALQHPHAAVLKSMAHCITQLTGASCSLLTEGANAAGAYLAGAIPHRASAGASVEPNGRSAKALLSSEPVSIYFLWNMEPEHDTAYPAAALKTLKAADYVVCFTPYVTETMKAYADLILPIAPFTETEGTFVNSEGRWQSFEAVTHPQGDAKPGWKVLRALAKQFELDGFQYQDAAAIRDELKVRVDEMPIKPYVPTSLARLPDKTTDIIRIASCPMYRIDNIVRRATALQDALQESAVVSMNESLAAKLNVRLGDRVIVIQGDSRITLLLMIDNRLSNGVVMIPAALEETAGFGEAMAAVQIERDES